MVAMNRLDRTICRELIKGNFTLSQVEAYNEPEYSGWAMRRRRVSGIFVWEFSWFVTTSNYLLRFPRKNGCCHPIESVYLPEAIIRRCCAKEECCVGHAFVMEIVPRLHFILGEDGLVSVKPQEVYISFDNVEDMCGCILFLAKIAARNARTAAITFGPLSRVDHRIHLNVLRAGNDFGLDLLPPTTHQWLLRQGLTADEVEGNEATALGCAKTLCQFQLQRGVKKDIPPVLKEKTIEAKHCDEVPAQCIVLPPELRGVTLKSLLSEGDPVALFSHWERLDSGSQGDVFKAVRNSDGVSVAIKRITVNRGKWDVSTLVKEITLMKTLRHPNIVTLYGCYKRERDLFLEMELMDGGKLTNLLSPLEGKRTQFTEAQLATLMREVLQALQCVHRARCIHRDVKSDNILLSSRGEVKLGDFGFATLISQPSGRRKTVVGTPYWMAPEVASGKPYNSKADVWSVGILFLEACDGQPPLMGMNPMRALLKITTGQPPVIKSAWRWSPLCKEFASFLLVKDPTRRPTVSDALKHPFIVQKAEPKCQFISTILAQRRSSSAFLDG